MQSFSKIVANTKPTPSFFTRRMSPNRQCQSTEGKLNSNGHCSRILYSAMVRAVLDLGLATCELRLG